MFFFGKKIAHKKPSQYQVLAGKWAARHKSVQEKLWEKHKEALLTVAQKTKQFAAGSLAGIMLLASPGAMTSSQQAPLTKEKPFTDLSKNMSLVLDLQSILPMEVRPLTPDEESKTATILSQYVGFSVSAQIQGIRLNRSYGYIGQEQHLARFPGDTMDSHFSTGEDAQKYYDYGMAKGLGAYGYFAKSANAMTPLQNAREKYYIAVQTFLSPGFLENTKKMNDFFAFRKMLVVNPDNGKAIVADIGDSGPSEWTGKSLGGSPEIMQYLERVDGENKGPVIYMFINDPHDTIPLGHIHI